MSVTHTITGGTVHLSGNPIQVILTGTNPGYKLAVKITCAELFGSPFVDEIKPDGDLKAEFDISGYFDQPVDYAFNYPGIGKVTAYDALAFTATIDIGEVYTDVNGDRQESWAGVNQSIRVLKGRLRPYELALLNEDGKSFASEFIDGGKFLTHLANNQAVGALQEMKLWYLSRWDTDHQAVIHMAIETDFYTEPFEITEDTNLIPSGLFEFTINPTFWGFNIPPGSAMPPQNKILAYSFWLTDKATGNDISERRRFVIDTTYYEKVFEFYYVNPLSGVDSIRLTGEHKQSVNTSVETATAPVPVGSGTKVPGIKTVSAGSQRSWEINTGYKSRDEMLALRDFLDSKQRWMVDPDRSTWRKLIPVYIEGAESLLYDSMEDRQSLSIKILEAHK